MPFRRYATLTIGVNLLVILWGAFVRASGSGAGCGRHWPLCNGQAIPQSPATATIIEFVHRTTSGLALLLVVALAIWAFRATSEGHPVRRWAALSVTFVVTEALIGAGLVLFGLVGTNDSALRAGYLAVHLFNTFVLLATLVVTAIIGTGPTPTPRPVPPGTIGSLMAGSIGILLVGMTGAITALGDTLFPSSSLAHGLAQDTSPTAHFLIRIRALHPILAVVAGGFIVGFALRILRTEAGGTVRWGQALVALVFLQLGVGVANLVLLAPVGLQLVHLLMADLVWIAQVGLAARLRWL